MKKFIFAILLVIAINFVFSSKCTDKKAAGDAKLLLTDCTGLETSDTKKVCVLSTDLKRCEEVSKVTQLLSKANIKKGVAIALIAAAVVALVLFILFLKCIF